MLIVVMPGSSFQFITKIVRLAVSGHPALKKVARDFRHCTGAKGIDAWPLLLTISHPGQSEATMGSRLRPKESTAAWKFALDRVFGFHEKGSESRGRSPFLLEGLVTPRIVIRIAWTPFNRRRFRQYGQNSRLVGSLGPMLRRADTGASQTRAWVNICITQKCR